MTVLAFIDTETTHLDPEVGQAYEVCWWREDQEQPTTRILPHTLDGADPVSLEVGGYHRRGVQPGYYPGDSRWQSRWAAVGDLTADLVGVTLVGSNPAFDASFLRPLIGTPWHHRLINVADGAMWLFGWDRPQGLDKITTELEARGFDIPAPDHTAEGDVRATRAVYDALRTIRAGMSA